MALSALRNETPGPPGLLWYDMGLFVLPTRLNRAVRSVFFLVSQNISHFCVVCTQTASFRDFQMIFQIFFASFAPALTMFSLPPILINSRNSDPGSHSRLFSPRPHHGSCLAFLSREDFSSILPSSTRVELCLPTLLIEALSAVELFFFFFFKKKPFSPHGGIPPPGPKQKLLKLIFQGAHIN